MEEENFILFKKIHTFFIFLIIIFFLFKIMNEPLTIFPGFETSSSNGTTNPLLLKENGTKSSLFQEYKMMKSRNINQNSTQKLSKNLKERWMQGLKGNKGGIADLHGEDITYGLEKLIDDDERRDGQKVFYINPALIPIKYFEDNAIERKFNRNKESFKLSDYDIIFIPIFNSGAAHWSLCVYRIKENVCYHYDSISFNGNSLNRKTFVETLDVLIKSNVIPDSIRAIQVKNWYVQFSNWECGYYLLLCAFIIINTEKEMLNEIIKANSNHRETVYDLLDLVFNEDLFHEDIFHEDLFNE